MKNIKPETNNYYLKIILYLMIPILIFISNSNIVFSKYLDENINILNSAEEELAIKFCDAINKKIFIGLDKETSLKYEYYFSSLKNFYNKDQKNFLKKFRLNVIKNCSYDLTEVDKNEFAGFIKKFLYQKK